MDQQTAEQVVADVAVTPEAEGAVAAPPQEPEAPPQGQEPEAEAPEAPPTVEERIRQVVEEGMKLEEEAPEASETDEDGQPRDEKGRFVSKDAGGEEEAVEAESEEEAPSVPTLTLMPRRPEEDPVEIPLTAEQIEALGMAPEELEEAINRTKNGYLRRQQVMQEREALAEQRRQVEAERTDFYSRLEDEQKAVDLIIEHTRPEVQERLLDALVTHAPEEIFNKILDRALEFSRDPRARELAATKDALRRREPGEQKQEESAPEVSPEVLESSKQILNAVAALAPESMPEGDFQKFFDEAVDTLVTYAEVRKLDELSADDAVKVLGSMGILEKHQISAPSGGSGPSRTDRQTSPSGSDQPESPKAGEDYQKRMERRKAVSAVTPGGQGSAPTAVPKPPPGMSVEERISWLRKNRGALS